MFKMKKYSTLDLVLIPLKIIPIQTLSSVLCILIEALLPAFQTLSIAYFINTATDIFKGYKAVNSIYPSIILVLLYVVLTHLQPSVIQLIEISGRNKLNTALSREIVSKRVQLDYLHIENKDTCELINRVCESFVSRFENGRDNLFHAVALIISTLSLLFIIMSYTVSIGAILILVSIPLFFLASKTGMSNYEMSKEARELQRRYKYLAEVLTERDYAEERTMFGYSNRMAKQYENLYRESYEIEKRIQIKSFINLKSGSIVSLLISIVILGILLFPFQSGAITAGVYIALVQAVLGMVQSMSWQLSLTLQEHAKTKEFLKEFSAFMNLSERNEASAVPINMDTFVFESLEFRKVSFRYPNTERYILNNCSFHMKKGNNYALVGINGAGKTTIIKLLVGLYENYEGEILINNKSIRNYRFAELKSLIAVVFQDFAKYALTVEENIWLGNIVNRDSGRMKEIIRSLDMKRMIEKLEFGIETPLGKIDENGVELSRGEWQRLAIARLLYAKAPINILDEPTAALDPMEESRIYEMFSQINQDWFTIFITHRMGAARIADQILVIDRGRIAEKGSHEELISCENSIYRKMFESQSAWYMGE